MKLITDADGQDELITALVHHNLDAIAAAGSRSTIEFDYAAKEAAEHDRAIEVLIHHNLGAIASQGIRSN